MRPKLLHFAALVAIGAAAAAAVTVPMVQADDVDRVATGHTVSRTVPSLLVVEVDKSFLSLSDSTYSGWLELVAGLLLHRPRQVVLETDVVDEARNRLTGADVAAIASQFAPGATTVDEVLAPFVHQLGRVDLAYTAEPSRRIDPVPTVHSTYPAAVMGDAAEQTCHVRALDRLRWPWPHADPTARPASAFHRPEVGGAVRCARDRDHLRR